MTIEQAINAIWQAFEARDRVALADAIVALQEAKNDTPTRT